MFPSSWPAPAQSTWSKLGLFFKRPGFLLRLHSGSNHGSTMVTKKERIIALLAWSRAICIYHVTAFWKDVSNAGICINEPAIAVTTLIVGLIGTYFADVLDTMKMPVSAYGFIAGQLGPALSGYILDETKGNFSLVFSYLGV